MKLAENTQRGIQYWMERAVKELAIVKNGFEADPVHDLRVALRRCRSIAEGFRGMDPDPAWKQMRKAGKAVFSAIGTLRDIQVLMDWTQKLTTDSDPVRDKLLAHCSEREQELKKESADALADFDTDRWLAWAGELQHRAEQIAPAEDVFRVIALQRWIEAERLHRVALRSGGKIAYHSLRIAIKHFRYIVENFLPALHQRWGSDLKEVQDLLGEVHDLDVLLETARNIRAFTTPQQRLTFRARVAKERKTRLDAYRRKTQGRNSLWQQWRAGLPDGDDLRKAVLRKFEIWTQFLDPDTKHTNQVLEFSLTLYDALVTAGLFRDGFNGVEGQDLLTVAVRTHEIGHASNRHKHHKRVRRMLAKLEPPPGWTATHLSIAAMVARYHKGSLPNRAHSHYAALPQAARTFADKLAGVLRLADALDANHDQAIRNIKIQHADGVLRIRAAGYDERSRNAEQVAAARHLLESTCGLPVIVESAPIAS